MLAFCRCPLRHRFRFEGKQPTRVSVDVNGLHEKNDLVIVKSLSRFGRDAVEALTQIRRLKSMNIGVYIETAASTL